MILRLCLVLPCLTSITFPTNQPDVNCFHSQNLKGIVKASIDYKNEGHDIYHLNFIYIYIKNYLFISNHYRYEGHHKCKAIQVLETQIGVERKTKKDFLRYFVFESYPTKVCIFCFNKKFLLSSL